MKHLVILLVILFCFACDKEQVDPPNPPIEEIEDFYFPPLASDTWETISPESLGWNTESLQSLYEFQEANGTRAFIVLKEGRIVVEKYWGKDILNIADFDQSKQWYWASAGKTITAFLTGIAQQEGKLDIENKSSDYLGENWTSMSKDKQDLITVRHQLTMSTGLDYQAQDPYCTDPSCLNYKADAGTQWYYHNAPYTLLKSVIENATGVDYNLYTDQKLESVTGMNGNWVQSGFNNVYWSRPRDMARFGLLILNKGNWDGTQILTDMEYYDDMVNTTQDLNPSYGYLWWLNGKSSIIYPGLAISFNTSLASNAPDDLIVGAGKNGQFVDVIPSQDLVVVRMGEAPDGAAVPISFHNDMWSILSEIVRE